MKCVPDCRRHHNVDPLTSNILRCESAVKLYLLLRCTTMCLKIPRVHIPTPRLKHSTTSAGCRSARQCFVVWLSFIVCLLRRRSRQNNPKKNKKNQTGAMTVFCCSRILMFTMCITDAAQTQSQAPVISMKRTLQSSKLGGNHSAAAFWMEKDALGCGSLTPATFFHGQILTATLSPSFTSHARLLRMRGSFSAAA